MPLNNQQHVPKGVYTVYVIFNHFKPHIVPKQQRDNSCKSFMSPIQSFHFQKTLTNVSKKQKNKESS